MSQITEKIFQQRGNFAIIGITGRTGSGCSTVAQLLCESEFSYMQAQCPKHNGDLSNEDRKYKICYNYLSVNWSQGVLVKVTYLILALIIDRFSLVELLKQLQQRQGCTKAGIDAALNDARFNRDYMVFKAKASGFIQILNSQSYHSDSNTYDIDHEKFVDNFISNEIKVFYGSFKLYLRQYITTTSGIEIFQSLGNAIREGIVYQCLKTSNIQDYKNRFLSNTQSPLFISDTIPILINKLIKFGSRLVKWIFS